MRKSILILLILTTAAMLSPSRLKAQHIIHEGEEDGPVPSRTIITPYGFSSETLGLGFGIGGTHSPKNNRQSVYYGMLYYTDNNSWQIMLGGYNLHTPISERLYIRPYGSIGQKTQMRLYVSGNQNFTTEPAGSNESSPDNYIEENAFDASLELEFRYTLPIGHFKDEPVHTYVTENGILKENPSGAESINPLASGQSVILFAPHYRNMFSDTDDLETLYFELGIEHDNRDFVTNPHKGYKWNIGMLRDFGWLADARSWSSVEGELDAFIPLPTTSWARQQTLALSGWYSYSPSYDPEKPDNAGRPPYFTGPTLGGFWRMKGFPSNRFHDKAAVYYGAEYRIMPEWQPLRSITILDPLMIRWWQFVVFAETGRVAPTWDFGTLHEDMKYDGGFGFRCMMDKGVIRLDISFSEEQTSLIVMFGQSF